jgi:flagellar basal-body rod protein FlgF
LTYSASFKAEGGTAVALQLSECNKRIVMQTGYYAAAGGMVTQFNRLDTIANNLANANTAGFKKDATVTGDFLRLYKEARDNLPLPNESTEGAQFYHRSLARVPQIVEGYTDHSLGTVQQTGNSFDFALGREGLFFVVKTPEGIRLTRDGSFTLSDEGTLVTKQGYEVLPSDYFEAENSITFSAADSVVEADKNGQFYISVPGAVELAATSKLMVVSPENLKRLQKAGDGLFILPEGETLKPLTESGAVLQGAIEKSNVNAVNEMVALIEANRLVGMYQKAMDSQMNDMNRDAIEKLAVAKR